MLSSCPHRTCRLPSQVLAFSSLSDENLLRRLYFITCRDLEYGHQRYFLMQAKAMSLFKGLTLRQEPHTLRLSRVLLSVFLGRILERRAVVPSAFVLRCRVHGR